jgi:hypothetical protein
MRLAPRSLALLVTFAPWSLLQGQAPPTHLAAGAGLLVADRGPSAYLDRLGPTAFLRLAWPRDSPSRNRCSTLARGHRCRAVPPPMYLNPRCVLDRGDPSSRSSTNLALAEGSLVVPLRPEFPLAP